MSTRRILFIHQNFPGQYRYLAQVLAATPGHEVMALGERANLRPPFPSGLSVVGYEFDPGQGQGRRCHPYIGDLDRAVRRGQAVARAALALKRKGLTPDRICCHVGWGEALFLKDVWPDVPVLGFFEFFYRSRGADAGFDPEFPDHLDDRMRIRAKNAVNLLSLDAVDWGVSPTRWQWSSYPEAWRSRISVIFDGVDTHRVRPDPGVRLTLEGGIEVGKEDELITFVNRNLEPYRGYHVFMRALPEVLARRPGARVLILGGDGVSYGRRLKDGSYKELYLEEVRERLDLDRVHFLGRLPYAQYLAILQASSVHVYLSYPFVLSWSMVEAMSAGCLLVASRTPPVEEFVTPGEHGLLVDFFDHEALADTLVEVLGNRSAYRHLGRAARQRVVEGYDLRRVCLPRHLELIEHLQARVEAPASAG